MDNFVYNTTMYYLEMTGQRLHIDRNNEITVLNSNNYFDAQSPQFCQSDVVNSQIPPEHAK